jgi:hypothetical protein
MDDPLIALTPGPTLPIAPPIAAARRATLSAMADLLAVPDGRLEAAWPWRPGDPEDVDVRYGFYRIDERLEEAAAAIAHGRAGSGEGADVGPAVPILASATAARWELRGALAAVDDTILDGDPGGGEWSIRRTLGHIVGGQRSYGWYSAWWLERGHADGPLPERPGDDRIPPEPEEEAEAVGSGPQILGRLDDLIDLAAGRFGSLDDRGLAVPARWSGLPVDLRFRLGRWGSHIREHTVQVDKTLAMLGQPTSEVERLVRIVAATYGRLEALVFARSDEVIARPFESGGSAAAVLEAGAREVAQLAQSVRRAATG